MISNLFREGFQRGFHKLPNTTLLILVGKNRGREERREMGMSMARLLNLNTLPLQVPPLSNLVVLFSTRGIIFNNGQQRQHSSSLHPPHLPKTLKKKRKKKESPRTKSVQPESQRLPQFESIIERDTFFRFLIKTKEFLSTQPDQVLQLDEAGKLHRELGFPRGRKVARSIERHPSLFQFYRHTDSKMWFGFTELMETLLEEENKIMDSMEKTRVTTVRKLLMMSAHKRIPMSKIHHCRLLFGIPRDFRDRALRYPQYFRVIHEDGKHILELAEWDPCLAVSALESDYIANEDRVKKAFSFPVTRGRHMNLEEEDNRKLNMLNTFPLVSPYSDGSHLELWSLEADKYRVGVLHEFLSLTLEKRASIHHIVEFKDEFSLTKHTYRMLLKQPKTFYLAGTEMNWTVFLKDAYDNGVLIEKDPQVIFNEKLYRNACFKGTQADEVVTD